MKLKLLFLLGLITQIGFSINPMKAYKMKPDQFNIEYEELKVETADQQQLNTWVMKTSAENKKNCTIIIVGSDAGNMGFSLPYAVYLLKEGFDVITFDYRGFGESSDFDFNPNNLYHQEYIVDFVSLLRWVKKEKQPAKIGTLAFSMGTLVAAAGYDEEAFDFYVGEGFIKSPKDNVKRIKKLKGKTLALPKSAKSDCRKIQKIDIPMLLFASKSDEITTLKDSEAFVKKSPNRKLVVFDGEHLRGAFSMGMGPYIQDIVKMVD